MSFMRRMFEMFPRQGSARIGELEAALQDVRPALVELKTIHEKSKRFGAKEGVDRAQQLLDRVNDVLERR